MIQPLLYKLQILKSEPGHVLRSAAESEVPQSACYYRGIVKEEYLVIIMG